MSQKSRTARRVAVAGGAALVALSAATSPAQAAQLKLDYQCKYPLIGVQPLSIAIDSNLPASWESGRVPAISISVTATAGGNTAKAIKTIGAQTIEGTASAPATVTSPGLSPLPVKVPITIAKWTRPAAVPDPLVLAASGQGPRIALDQAGTAKVTVDSLSLNLKATDKNGNALQLAPVTTDVDGQPITPADSDPGTFDVPCKLNAGQSTTLASIAVSGAQPTADTTAPTKPTGVKGTASSSVIDLSWNASSDDKAVYAYEIYDGTTKLATVGGTKALVGGLNPGQAYALKVVAVDAAGNATESDVVSVTTSPAGDAGPGGQVIDYGYSIAGTSQLRTLTTGPIGVTGSIGAKFDLLTGDFTGELALNKTRAKLNLLSFLPVTADIAFAQAGPTVGKLQNGVLKATARMRIRLTQLYLFGVVPIAGPGTCQTRGISTMPLQSSDPFFDPLNGGTLKGAYAISDLTGCGVLNDIISPFAAGGGNTLSIKLTPKA